MAHWAELDDNDVVVQVIRYDADEDTEGAELDAPPAGLAAHAVAGGRWARTWYDTPPHHYAGVGWVYDEDVADFMPPSPYPSWVFDAKLWGWEAPTPVPTEPGVFYNWDERLGVWTPRPT